MGRSYGGSKWTAAVALAFWATLMVMIPEVSSKRFIVGGSMGWTSNVNYTLWAGNQTFYFGDWLFFVYDRNQNDILEVNKTNYEMCIAEHPIHNYTTGAGRDIVELNVTHDRYFVSSKGSCYGGMKLHVHLSPIPPPPRAAPHLSPIPPPPRAAPHLSPIPPPPRAAPHLSPIPPPPRAAPLKSHSSRFTVFRSQLVIPAVVTIAAIWDSLLLSTL